MTSKKKLVPQTEQTQGEDTNQQTPLGEIPVGGGVDSDAEGAKPQEIPEEDVVKIEEIVKLKTEMNYIFTRGKYPLMIVGQALLDSLGDVIKLATADMSNEDKTRLKIALEQFIHQTYKKCGMEYLG